MKCIQILLLPIFLVFACQQKTYHGDLIIVNASIVDVESIQIIEHQTLIITHGKIQSIVPFSSGHTYEAKEVIDGENIFVIPGLWDMHTHYVTAKPNFLDLFISNGILGVRELWGNLHNRDSIVDANPLAPRIYLSGAIIDGPSSLLMGATITNDPNDAIRLVDSLYSAGADFIKVYDNISREVYKAIAQRCKELDFPFCGHTPNVISAEEASQLGQKSIEHLNGIFESASKEEDRIDSLEQLFNRAFELGDISNALMAFTNIMDAYTTGYDEHALDKLSETLRDNHTFITPTLILHQKNWFRNSHDYTTRQENKYIPKSMLEGWHPQNDFPSKIYSEATWQAGQNSFITAQKITKRLRDNNIKILAGTDCGISYVVPGFSLHEELDLLVKSGLSNGEALQTATLNPAVFLNTIDSLGTIAEGKIADLVILGSNPLDNIENTQSILGVVKNGIHLNRETLDDLLSSLEIDKK